MINNEMLENLFGEFEKRAAISETKLKQEFFYIIKNLKNEGYDEDFLFEYTVNRYLNQIKYAQIEKEKSLNFEKKIILIREKIHVAIFSIWLLLYPICFYIKDLNFKSSQISVVFVVFTPKVISLFLWYLKNKLFKERFLE